MPSGQGEGIFVLARRIRGFLFSGGRFRGFLVSEKYLKRGEGGTKGGLMEDEESLDMGNLCPFVRPLEEVIKVLENLEIKSALSWPA